MPRYILVLLASAMLLILRHPVAIAADDEFETLLSANEGCVSIDGYYVPKKLRDTVRSNNDGTVTMFEGKNVVEIMNAYYGDIDESLKEAAKPNNKSFYILLDCSIKLNQSEEKLIAKWYGDSMLEMIKKNAPLLSIESIDGIYNAASSRICKQYNKIALVCERKDMIDEAEDIYRTVLRNYPRIQGCFREAEIALQNLRRKGATGK